MKQMNNVQLTLIIKVIIMGITTAKIKLINRIIYRRKGESK